MKQLFQKINTLKVLVFFFEHPDSEVYLRELARKLRLSPPTLMRILDFLVRGGLLQRRDSVQASYFRANPTPAFKALAVAHTLSKFEAAGAVGAIQSKSTGLFCILLYGSAARGEDGSGSDYDILVIAASCRADWLSLSRSLGREVNAQTFTISQWKTASERNRAFYLEVISSSIPLLGKKPVMN